MFQPRRAHVRVFPSTFTHVTGLRFPRRSGRGWQARRVGRSWSSLTSLRLSGSPLAASRAGLPRAGKCKETSSRALAEKAVTRRRAARLHAASRPACGAARRGVAWPACLHGTNPSDLPAAASGSCRSLSDAPRSRSCVCAWRHANGRPRSRVGFYSFVRPDYPHLEMRLREYVVYTVYTTYCPTPREGYHTMPPCY